MTDIVERIKDAENATRALYNHIFQDAREEIERLRIENEALRAEVIHIKEVEFPRKAQAAADGWRGKCERLEAKIEAMEKQEPVAWTTKLALEYGASRLGFQVSGVNMWGENGVPLYALPGAQPALSEQDESVRKAWARLSNELHRGPDAPYPGMSEAFEQHFSQSFTDRDWRAESGTWAAAWKAAKRHGAQPAPSLASDDVSLISEGKTQPAQSVKDAIIDDLQSQFDTEGITEHDSGDALIRLSDAIAAVEDNFAQPAPSIPEGLTLVPIEVIYLYSIMCAAFVPMTPQQKEIALQLELAKRAMLAVAPEAKP